MPQVRADSLPQLTENHETLIRRLTENHETLIRRASEQAADARSVESGQLDITNDSVMDGNSSAPLCREYSEPRWSQNAREQTVLTNHVKIGPVTGIELLKSAGTYVIEVQVPSQQPGNSKSWVRTSRGIEQHGTTICSCRD